MQSEELKYPVQPFVFEFARDASKKLSFSDIQMKQPQKVDVAPIENYLKTNNAFLKEYEEINKPDVTEVNTIQDCQVSKIFFDPLFDLKRTRYFNEVFTSGCLNQRLFSEQLILQLDTVQNLLYHSSDNHALEFFKSFGAIHDMNQQISVLLPKIKEMRKDLENLKKNADAPNVISALKNKKSRLQNVQNYLNNMKKVVDASPAAIAYAETGDFASAFSCIDETIELLKSNLLQIKSMHGYLNKLQETKKIIIQKLKDAFCGIFTREDAIIADLVSVIVKQNMLDEIIEYTTQFMSKYSHEQVLKIINDSAEQNSSNNQITIKNFTETLQNSFTIIRLRLFARGANIIENVASEFSKYSENSANSVRSLIQILCNDVYQEVIGIINNQPLSNISLDDFTPIYDSIISFGRGFDKYSISDNILQDSLNSFCWQFIETFDKDLKLRIERSIQEENWSKTPPRTESLAILRRLTTGENLSNLTIDNNTYVVTSSTLAMIEVIWNYVEAARRIKGTAGTFTTKLAEAIKSYSNICLSYILGGEAKKRGQLDKISTRHLALTAGNNEFLCKVLSYIIPRLVVVGAKQDQVNKQIKGAAAILDENKQKLISQIVLVLKNNITKIVDNANIDQNSVSPYVASVAKEVSTLGGFIFDYLPQETSQGILNSIGMHINDLMPTVYRKYSNKQQFNRDFNNLAERVKNYGITLNSSN